VSGAKKQNGAGRKSGEPERSGERTSQKTLVELERSGAEREQSGERAKSASHLLTPNMLLLSLR